MSRRKASIYSIAANHSRAIESQLITLSEQALNGEIHGMTYAVSDKKKALRVGSMGSHSGNDDHAIATLFRCAVALVLAA